MTRDQVWNDLTTEQVDLYVFIALEAQKREAQQLAFEVREVAIELLKAMNRLA